MSQIYGTSAVSDRWPTQRLLLCSTTQGMLRATTRRLDEIKISLEHICLWKNAHAPRIQTCRNPAACILGRPPTIQESIFPILCVRPKIDDEGFPYTLKDYPRYTAQIRIHDYPELDMQSCPPRPKRALLLLSLMPGIQSSVEAKNQSASPGENGRSQLLRVGALTVRV
jgi:hypothetical protein